MDFEPAYLLHARPYRESSLLAEMLVAGRGRVGVVMRGARSAKRQAAQLFQPLLVQLAGEGELKTLKGLETAGSLLPLAGHALFSGFYLNELLVRLLQRELPQPELFLAYAQALAELVEQGSSPDVEPVLRRFESLLLEQLGYAIVFDNEGETATPVQPDLWYGYHPEQGLYRSARGHPGWVLLQLAAGEFAGVEARLAAKQILRQALARQLGGRPLKSRELFLKI